MSRKIKTGGKRKKSNFLFYLSLILIIVGLTFFISESSGNSLYNYLNLDKILGLSISGTPIVYVFSIAIISLGILFLLNSIIAFLSTMLIITFLLGFKLRIFQW